MHYYKVRLSAQVRVPDYKHPSELFALWSSGNKKERNLYQKLVNAGFNIFEKVSHDKMSKVNWVNKDLHGACLKGAYMQDLNLRNVNFRNANLEDVNLKNSDLRGTNLVGACLKTPRSLAFTKYSSS